MKTILFVCIRHGESVWNAEGLWTGWHDVSLSQKGEIEAKNAANILKNMHFDVAFTSDLKRAYDTLQIILDELGINIPVFKNQALRERNYGIYTGKNKWEIKKSVGEYRFNLIRRGWDEPIPQGEKLKDVYDRVVPYFKESILPVIKKGQNILFVTHGNTNRALIKYLESVSDSQIASIEMKTGEIIIYQLDKEGKVISKVIKNI